MIELLAVTDPRLAYLVLGGFVAVFGLFSLLIREKWYISEVVIGTTFGIIMGPYAAGIFDPRSWASDNRMITLEVMRVVLAVGLFAIGVELPASYMGKHVRGLVVLVIPTMAIGWLVVAGFMFLLFPSLSFISCLVVAATLTPTDPVISAAIVGNGKYALEHVPAYLRNVISAESAANDGLAYPFLSLSIYLTVEATKGEAFKKWLLVGCLYQVILGTTFGAVMGYGFRKLLAYSHKKGLGDGQSFLIQYIALAFFTIGVASNVGMDDLLAAFAAGCAVSWDGNFKEETEKESFAAVIDLMLNCACFIYIGAWMDFASFNSPHLGITPWRLIVLFIWIAVFRRIPAILMLYKWVPEVKTWKEALFTGHFGPMGVGAMFISTLALSELKVPHNPPQDQEEYLAATLQIIVSFIVLCSIFIHGMSIPIYSAACQIRSRAPSLTRTWTSGRGKWDRWQLDWSNRIRRSGSKSPSQTITKRDEETGDRSGTQTKVGDTSGIDESEETASVVGVRNLYFDADVEMSR
ncbi:Sodium/hydrogen exchanger family-domain-containing protein [Thelephora terrestris]|uniref:Sodium/hydrogen exchanger family-domain-containing protein n=1 Tax=Thelephora terrestris TaxID=56493 RepID=A0A9P6HRI7_9AGAM|nr:Sodium/hydrogen exchanger family-domain-containing protein [Thelephora terrestris]